jgi:hypothetical protein
MMVPARQAGVPSLCGSASEESSPSSLGTYAARRKGDVRYVLFGFRRPRRLDKGQGTEGTVPSSPGPRSLRVPGGIRAKLGKRRAGTRSPSKFQPRDGQGITHVAHQRAPAQPTHLGRPRASRQCPRTDGGHPEPACPTGTGVTRSRVAKGVVRCPPAAPILARAAAPIQVTPLSRRDDGRADERRVPVTGWRRRLGIRPNRVPDHLLATGIQAVTGTLPFGRPVSQPAWRICHPLRAVRAGPLARKRLRVGV